MLSRPTTLVNAYSAPVRLLAIFLAGLLALPGPGAQGQNSNNPTSDARNSNASDNAQPTAGQVHQTIYHEAPFIPQDSPGRLGCKDTELRGLDVVLGHRNLEADRWGDITVAQPKIWQFERVSALLDGLLRDVEGVSLGDLTQLDPSQQNGAALKFVQSALEVGVQYDQAAAVNAANTLSSYNALHASQLQQLDHYNTYMQTLTSERDRLAAQYSAASNEVNALQALQAAGNLTDAQQKQLAEAQSRQASTQASLASVNSLISGAGAAPTLSAPPTVTGTSVQGPASGSSMSSSLSGFSDVLKNLPSGVQDNLSTALKAPSYPATKRLDNFITLLYERLAREISVLQDDLSRDPDNVAFLLQFDVGLYPSKKAKDHVARVEFNLDCPGCKVYSLYPGQSSYNLANYSGSSKRNTFWGNVLTLIGLGVSASYRRQTDTLQGSLVQSVYTAGFQNGVMTDEYPRESTNKQVNANQAEQSFGWYYGAAPFEQLVTPGIRSTFALITVPGKLIERTEDKFGNTNACLPFHIDAGWANRNDPVAQDSYSSPLGSRLKHIREPFYRPKRDELIKPGVDSSSTLKDGDSTSNPNPPYDASVLTMQTSVNLPRSLDDYPLIAKREKKLHVLRMEYNTVSEPPDTVASATVQTTVQTGTQSTNPATGQIATQTTSTTVAVGSSAGSGVAGVSPALDPLPCPKGKCAAVLIGLDRPIDPNLAVTVRGKPLMRVRDWRGRATSVLPPAQSGSDLAAAANTAGSLNTKQLQQTRSLLESDQFAPNTWFALSSHELLLNVSVDVATKEEFPVVQLVDPSGPVVIPHDLRTGFTELLINGFRLQPQTEHSVQQETRRQNWREREDEPVQSIQTIQKNAPISSGPYAFSTYLPLFSPEPAPQKFFATIGETGNDLLIGFLPNRAAQIDTERPSHYDWLAAQTQVILEDRDLPFAWSLSCDVQGDLLACHMPREEVSRVYWNFRQACPNDEECPRLGADRQSLLQSQPNTRKDGRPRVDLRDFQNAYISTMQVWVYQADEEGKNVFYSPEPVHIGFLPLSSDYWSDTLFKPWRFESADADSVTLNECNYLPNVNQCHVSVSVLGVRSWPNWAKQPESKHDSGSDWTQLIPGNEADRSNPKCGKFTMPTAALANDPLVFVMAFPQQHLEQDSGETLRACGTGGNQGGNISGLRTTIAIPKSRLAPRFKQSEIQIRRTVEPPPSNDSKKQTEAKVWQIEIPVLNSACGDTVELPTQLVRSKDTDFTTIDWHWRNGNTELATCPPRPTEPLKPSAPQSDAFKRWEKAHEEWKKADDAWVNAEQDREDAKEAWKLADKSDRVRLYLEIPKTAMNDLPGRVDVVRTTTDGVKWVVATLPNLRRLLLPSRLTLDTLGPTQFALRGDNAEVIDAVTMQSSDGKNADPFPTAPGVDFALVTLPASSETTPKSDTSGGGAGSNSSTQITIDTTKDSAGHVKLTTQSTSPPAKPAAGADKTAATPPDDKKEAKSLPAGSYAVIPLIQVGTTPPDPKKKSEAEKARTDAEVKLKAANLAVKNAPADKAAKQKANQAEADLTKAKAAAAKAAERIPLYMPLTVTDEKGKPLIFTIAEAKKQAAAPQTSAPAAATPCSSSCVASPCAMACPASQAASPKSQ